MSKSKKIVHFIQDNKMFVLGLVIVLLFVLLAIFPGLVTHYQPDEINARAMLQAPSAEHWFGTDNYGADTDDQINPGGIDNPGI